MIRQLNSILLRLSAICLIAVFFFYSFGFHFYYQLRIDEIREKNNIGGTFEYGHSDLISFAAPLEEITWLGNDEISWKGERYDLANIKISDHLLTALAFHDMEEQELNEAYENSGEREHKSNAVQKEKTADSFIASRNNIIHDFPENKIGFISPHLNQTIGFESQNSPPPES